MPNILELPTVQGVHSSTFSRPPLDSSASVPGLFAYHAEHSPYHPLFIFSDEGQIRKICYPEAYTAILKAHTIARDHVRNLKGPGSGPAVIAILARINSDTISFFTMVVGIMHTGSTPFPISTRNSVGGVAHLLRESGARLLFISPDSGMQRLGRDAVTMLAQDGTTVGILDMPQFTDLYNSEEILGDVGLVEVHPHQPMIILHSSGSTAQPKLVRFLGKNFIQWGILPYYGEADICGLPIAIQSLPIFHAMGAISFVWTTCSGSIMACFKPSSPPVFPTPEIFLKSLIETECQLVFCVPAFVEAWASTPENLPILQALKAIIYAGAPMNKSIGNQLTGSGVSLIPFYGSTEIGCLSMFIPNSTEKDEWEYFKVSSQLDVKMLPQDGARGIFEPIVKACDFFSPHMLNTEVDGVPSYATSDLLQQHPHKPNMFKIYGRVDDQLMLSTSEKTNPAPLETILLRNKNIDAAIMFGRGRFQNGVLVQPEQPFDPQDEGKLADFRNVIWPSVEEANNYAPSHSRIFKEMIIVTSPEKPLEFTPKGTPRRQVCLVSYANEIEAAYIAVESSSQANTSPNVWTDLSTLYFIRYAVKAVVKAPCSDEDDLFQQGCDSLQATWIRNTIIHALRTTTEISVHQIPHNFVYANPSTRSLSNYVWSLFSTDIRVAKEGSAVEVKILEMEALLARYTTDLPPRVVASSASNTAVQTETILLTGSTGRYGCHILSHLLGSPNIVKVYALNRGTQQANATIEVRQREAFQKWGLKADTELWKKVVLIETDLSKVKLGLQEHVYDELQNSVTTIIHNAWRVDFNASLRSFEPLITGIRNLGDFALTSPVVGGPRFVFISSISVLRNHPLVTPAKEASIEASSAVGGGYSESKWVAEKICARISSECGLRTLVVRVGQLSGDTAIGGWGPKEWVPLLVQMGRILGSLPLREEDVAWLPVDTAAAALLDLLPVANERASILHLNHPRPVSWNLVFKAFADRLGLQFILYEEWIENLNATIREASAPSLENEVAFTLLDFFQHGSFGAGVNVAIDEARVMSSTLDRAAPLDEGDIEKYLKYWESIGHIAV
ncbi:acetyl-CoA synthetase-like protein [Crucibulum laeve]|uniref:Acetyl-CoA synthetase-like protein n=1 Tax=Crucibulum laeve TaxID=68775 RepID=A0A5C3LHI7_9AGAR|nr:acetyl-CoA synthetase-like protein [Crucibulum laeve]